MRISAVDFLYTSDIRAINKEQFEEHYKLYEGYVKQINAITRQLANISEEELKKANGINGVFRGLKRGESFALNGVILHELYFYNLGGFQVEPDEEIKQFIATYFGSYEKWKENFIATGLVSRGWAILCYDQRGKMLRNISLDEHDRGNIEFGLPIVVMDVYEHAYFLQYGTDKKTYLEAFLSNINWEIVKNRVNLWKLDEKNN